MPSNQVTSPYVIKGFADATRAFADAPQAQQRANSVKVCGNTYLIAEYAGETLTSYALAFHGSKIVRYRRDWSYDINLCGFPTNTTRHRINQFSPFTVSQAQGQQWCEVNDDREADGKMSYRMDDDGALRIFPADTFHGYQVVKP